MVNIEELVSNYFGAVGFKEEDGIALNPMLKISDTGFFVNDLDGINLTSIDKALKLKPDLTKYKNVSEFLSSIYREVIVISLYEFIDFSKKKYKIKDGYYEVFGNILEGEYLKPNKKYIGVFLKGSKEKYYSFIELRFSIKNAQQLKYFYYDIDERVILHSSIIDCQKGVNKISLSFNLYDKNTVLYFENYDENNPQVWQLQPDNELLFFNYKDNSSIFGFNSNDLDETINQTSKTCIQMTYRFDLDYNFFLIDFEAKRRLGQILQYQFAIRILEYLINSHEFNTVTESNREQWKQSLYYLKNKLYGYKFLDEKGKEGTSKGIYDYVIESFEGTNEVLFPELRRIQL